jgi:ferric-dicitrate binding protein FerR (iron transport regulator)
MRPVQPSDDEGGDRRLRLEDLRLAEAPRRAIGDRLEAAARGRRRRQRWLRAALGAGAAAAAAAGILLAARARPGGEGGAARDQGGARLRTGSGDFQLLSLGERGVAFVSEESELEVHPGRTPALRVHRGSVRLVVRRQAGEPFVVSTALAEIQVLGTEFDVTVGAQATEVSVVRGEVEVRNAHGRRRLWPRESARVRPGQAPRMVVPVTAVVVDGPAEIVEPPPGRPQ